MLGAAGGIGQPLSLLLKDVDHITELRLYDIENTPGGAADLAHIPTRAKVRARVSRARAPSRKVTSSAVTGPPCAAHRDRRRVP